MNMGTAIIIPSILFDDSYGRVTLVGDRKPDSIEILAEDSYTANEAQLGIRFSPANASLRNVSWSITSGMEYASIDSSGKLTINNNASSSLITVRAASLDDGSVYDTKDITVTHVNPVVFVEKLSISGNPTFNTHCALYDDTYSVEMKYCITDSAGHVGMLWGSLDEGTSAYIEDMNRTIVGFLADNDRAPLAFGTLIHYSTQTILNAIRVDEFFINDLKRSGSSVSKYRTVDSSPVFKVSGELYILSPVSSYMFLGIDIYYFKIKKDGVVVHDFRACTNNGVYGFYDIISNKFIQNTGRYGTVTA